jgi:hypothetical protein
MRKFVLTIIFFFVCFLSFTFAQPYKWPYVGEHIPPHISLSGGLQGFSSKAFFAGLSWNTSVISTNSPGGASFGPRVYYKQFNNGKQYKAVEAELTFYCTAVLGINCNYNIGPGYNFVGFKPFIGIGYFHTTFTYGYNFFADSKNREAVFKHNVFQLSINIPVCKLTKAKQ